MEVDNSQADCDGQLLLALRQLGTHDRDELIREFQRLATTTNTSVSQRTAEFFLELSDWNLQAAMNSFFDFGAQPDSQLPSMAFVSDVTIGEGESVPPQTKFNKIWRIANPGPDDWPFGCSLAMVEGTKMSSVDSVPLPMLSAMDQTDVSVEMCSPEELGIFQSRWVCTTPAGVPFGEAIWCIVVVENAGILGLTQQFASTNCRSETEMDSVATNNSMATKRLFTLSFEQNFGTQLIDRLKSIDNPSININRSDQSSMQSTTTNSVLYPSLSNSFQTDFDVNSRINAFHPSPFDLSPNPTGESQFDRLPNSPVPNGVSTPIPQAQMVEENGISTAIGEEMQQ